MLGGALLGLRLLSLSKRGVRCEAGFVLAVPAPSADRRAIAELLQ